MKKIKTLFINRFTAILFVFVVWMAFFDQNNMIHQYKLVKELDDARQTEQYFRNEIEQDSLAVYQMQNDIRAVERVGREQYKMKQDDETIFLIVRDDENSKESVQ